MIALVMATLALATYVVPGMERVRPWVAGEGVPVVRLFAAEHHAELPQFEGAEAVVPKAPPDVAAPTPSRNPTPADPAPLRSAAGPAIDPSEYEGVVQSIENTAALGTFYAALERTMRAQPGAITRVAHYGDSAIAADEITVTMRRRMQARFGDAGHGFMLVARGTMHYLHRDIAHRESDGWELSSIVRSELRSGLYGYGGILARGRSGEYSTFGTVDDNPVGKHVSRFELFYQKYPGGGDVRLSIDGDVVKTLRTRADTVEDAWETLPVPDGPHTLSIKPIGSEVRLFGVVLERDVPGVVYDSLGLVGAQADRLLNAEPAHMARQIAHRNPDLLVIGFGGNEAGNEWLDPARYAASLEKVIKQMRAGKPSMSCLLFAPLDQGERDERGNIVTLKVLPGIVAAQRRIAAEQGCAYFDALQAMGGPGAVARWYKQRPRLMTSDFRHATPAGYEVIAVHYYKALLKGFAEYLAKR
jgi:lysophospholipase L1-like esterase